MQNQKNMQTKGENANSGHCVGIHELIDWQVIQYRKAVDTHRHDLSKIEGRCVAWQEAEKDFNAADRLIMGEKDRVEYCGIVCPSRKNCLVALRFSQNEEAKSISRAG